MIEFNLLIPVRGNDGAAFSKAHHAAFEGEALAAFGGFSLLPGLVVGGWAQGGVVYSDDLYPYVVVGSLLDGGKVRALAVWATVHYGQEAIYVSALGVAEIVPKP